jgi:Uma2 family endonuclease
MGAVREHPPLRDVADFLAWAETQRERHEFVRGRVVMMAGGSTAHNDIQVNLIAALRRVLRGTPCRPNGPDLLVRTDARTGRFPDASVSCGERGRDHVADPVAVFEILSPSTEAEDRGPKRREYQGLPSLRHYVLLSQDAARAELFTRAERGWLIEDVEGLDAELPLDALGVSLPLAELYEGVDLPTPAAA